MVFKYLFIWVFSGPFGCKLASGASFCLYRRLTWTMTVQSVYCKWRRRVSAGNPAETQGNKDKRSNYCSYAGCSLPPETLFSVIFPSFKPFPNLYTPSFQTKHLSVEHTPLPALQFLYFCFWRTSFPSVHDPILTVWVVDAGKEKSAKCGKSF